MRREERSAAFRPWGVAAACAAVLAALVLPGPAAGQSSVTSPDTARFKDCHDQTNSFEVDMEQARMRVPADYEVTKADPEGEKARFEISELRCDKHWVSGTELDRVSLAFAVFELEHAPGTTPMNDPLPGDSYLLFVSTNSKPLADWLRADTGLEAYYVPEMVYGYLDPIPELPAEGNFSFTAPGPRKWAFTVTGTARVQRQAPLLITEGWAWQDTKTPDGKTWRAKIESGQHENYATFFGNDLTVDANDNSELAQILGTADGIAKDDFAVSGFIPSWEVRKTRTIIRP